MSGLFSHPDSDSPNAQWELLLPHQYRERFAGLPVAFLPLGTVEWHGEHNALGLDALKAHALCVMAARLAGGGIVHPPLYGGMGGLDKPATVILEGEYTWDNHVLRPFLERLCMEFHRLGFKAIVILTGHYGHNQQIVVREAAVRMSERLRIPVFGLPEYFLAQDAGYLGDHAGIGESSLLLYLYPELSAMDRIGDDPDYGADDAILDGTSRELGRRYAERISGRLAELAKAAPGWDEATLDRYIAAERNMLSAQVKGWRTREPWAAWKRMFSGEITDYAELLASERFEEISALSRRLFE